MSVNPRWTVWAPGRRRVRSVRHPTRSRVRGEVVSPDPIFQRSRRSRSGSASPAVTRSKRGRYRRPLRRRRGAPPPGRAYRQLLLPSTTTIPPHVGCSCRQPFCCSYLHLLRSRRRPRCTTSSPATTAGSTTRSTDRAHGGTGSPGSPEQGALRQPGATVTRLGPRSPWSSRGTRPMPPDPARSSRSALRGTRPARRHVQPSRRVRWTVTSSPSVLPICRRITAATGSL